MITNDTTKRFGYQIILHQLLIQLIVFCISNHIASIIPDTNSKVHIHIILQELLTFDANYIGLNTKSYDTDYSYIQHNYIYLPFSKISSFAKCGNVLWNLSRLEFFNFEVFYIKRSTLNIGNKHFYVIHTI